MKPVEFKWMNRIYTSPENWTEKDGDCGDLPVFVGKDSLNHDIIISAWRPSEEDLKRLNNGGHLYVQVVGGMLPPIALFTDNPFDGSDKVVEGVKTGEEKDNG